MMMLMMMMMMMTQGIFIFSADLIACLQSHDSLAASAENSRCAIKKRRRLQIGRDTEMHNLQFFNSTDTLCDIESTH